MQYDMRGSLRVALWNVAWCMRMRIDNLENGMLACK
jgi:hypothetical protein